jgi:LmbE family N-acetylglucosaminyl deacetylase
MGNALAGRTVVFLHAHPDDEAIFTGATMRRLADHGARVILVTATSGEEGTPLVALAPGETMAARRLVELEAACDVLGVARLELLHYRDSGMPQTPANRHPRAFAAHANAAVATLARLVEQEQADALVYYDSNGIYGHPDHVAVHRLGAAAVAATGVPGYEATVDREHLWFVGRHLVEGDRPRGKFTGLGRSTVEITTALWASEHELAVKRAAMAAHRSQIGPEALEAQTFADTYQLEWYVRTGAASVLEVLGNEHATTGPATLAADDAVA